MRLGIIARADKSGLGNQTKNLVYMLKPNKVLVINSKPFNQKEQYFDIYSNFNAFKTKAFPTNRDIHYFLKDIDVLLTAETFYTQSFIAAAKARRVKTFNQFNYEFLDNINNPSLRKPDIFLAPSYWKLDECTRKLKNVIYMPPPVDSTRFNNTRIENFSTNEKRFLHIVGNRAVNDRNGTEDILEALKYTQSEFELTIKGQYPEQLEPLSQDRRVKYDFTNPLNEEDLYYGFDAMILPRRYGGLCLPMNEALMSGLPVIMTDVEPNNKILPDKWLVSASVKSKFYTRMDIEIYGVNPKELAEKIDWLCNTDLNIEKTLAYEIGYDNYSYEVLKPKYERVLYE